MKKENGLLLTIGAIATLITILVLADGMFNRKISHESDGNIHSIDFHGLTMCDIPVIKRDRYTLRGLSMDDYGKGFIDCLNELTKSGVVTREQFEERYLSLCKEGNYKIVVAYDPSKEEVIGSGTLFIEKKFIRGCASKGHIEDVVVSKERRGEGIGRDVIEMLIDISRNMGCYKTALVCDPKNVEFYMKCGMTEKEREMVVYH
ncbi:GLUCOSAMINE PHOSPHATE N-ACETYLTRANSFERASE [Encephalitozoon cuniculi GB-M1]|uniref:Glucosamine 6-phosphate N-acetyltransferase n=1 Tax=Encephalitozoon cuniculi (strain GB-M1) TaxID=284813 RepID=Q8SRG4_ENCCU|nr:uncharacterized protein ECU07_1760 [Encephalitozoon cuniculi GB-M1]CAD25707.1 GLUCOSAMINE PHOSPHATE N-ACETYLTRANSFERASE [Encephalitozoon cuniculi GB-M1]